MKGGLTVLSMANVKKVAPTKRENFGTNLLFSPPGLLGKASISIGPQAEAATGLTTGMPDQAPLLGVTLRKRCRRQNKQVKRGGKGRFTEPNGPKC